MVGEVNVRALHELAGLLRSRNAIDAQIARVIDRPALAGHLGEWLASQIFDIELANSAVTKGIDGWFRGAPEAGASVNVKLYGTRAGAVDLTEDAAADYYLVLTGPIAQPVSSRGTHRPLCVHGVYLFRTADLIRGLRSRGLRIGVASSVRKELWQRAEIYPASANPALALGEAQQYALSLFRDTGSEDQPVAPGPTVDVPQRVGDTEGPYHTWSELSVTDRRAAALDALRSALVDCGFSVTGPPPGRKIVLDARRGEEAIQIHLQSSMGIGPTYWRKSNFALAAHRYGGLAILDHGQPPKLFLIPSLDWNSPDGVLVDRTYEAAASPPEWGVNLPGGRAALGRYALHRVLGCSDATAAGGELRP